MGSPRGYLVEPGMYRVPDLLTEQQFVDYMWNNYRRRVEFTDGLEVSPARALGRSLPVGPVDEVDDEQLAPSEIKDKHLRRLNEMDFSVVRPEQNNEENKEAEVQEDAPSLPVGQSKSAKK